MTYHARVNRTTGCAYKMHLANRDLAVHVAASTLSPVVLEVDKGQGLHLVQSFGDCPMDIVVIQRQP